MCIPFLLHHVHPFSFAGFVSLKRPLFFCRVCVIEAAPFSFAGFVLLKRQCWSPRIMFIHGQPSHIRNQNGLQATSGFEMCFAIGSQQLWCRGSQPKHVSNQDSVIKTFNAIKLMMLLVCLFACLLVCLFACLLVCLFACLLVCLFAGRFRVQWHQSGHFMVAEARHPQGPWDLVRHNLTGMAQPSPQW